MKTIINGYLQEDLIKHEVDLVDIEIIKYFQQFAQSKNMKFLEKDNKLYFWLSYQKIIDDLPIINIKSKRTIARRFDTLAEKGIFDKVIKNEGMKNFTYFRLTELQQSWIENMDVRFKKVDQPIKKTETDKQKVVMFDEFWKLYPRKNNKPDARKAYNKITIKQHERIIKDLPLRVTSEEWIKDDGKWIPYAQKYINQKQWTNPITIKEQNTKKELQGLEKEDYQLQGIDISKGLDF